MPDDDEFYFDEPSRPVRPSHIERPLPELEKYSELRKRLAAETEEFQRRALEARKTGKREAQLYYTYENIRGEERCSVVEFGASPAGWSIISGLSVPAAEQYVELVNNAHTHVQIILDAYLDNNPKRAIKHVRALFQTIKQARRVGCPEKPGKANAMRLVLDWLERCQTQPQKAKVKKALERVMQQSGKCPARSTLYAWAEEALAEDARRRSVR